MEMEFTTKIEMFILSYDGKQNINMEKYFEERIERSQNMFII